MTTTTPDAVTGVREFYQYIGQPNDLFSRKKIGSPSHYVLWGGNDLLVTKDGVSTSPPIEEVYAMCTAGAFSTEFEPSEYTTGTIVHVRIYNGHVTKCETCEYRVAGQTVCMDGDRTVIAMRYADANGGIASYAEPKAIHHVNGGSLPSAYWEHGGYTISALIMDMSKDAIRDTATNFWLPAFSEMAAARKARVSK